MWNRKDLKAQGKAAMKRNYWKSVLVGVIDVLTVGGAWTASRNSESMNSAVSQIQAEGLSPDALLAFLLAFVGLLVLIVVIGVALNALLIGPLRVGTSHFKLSALKGTGNLSELGCGFDANYKVNVKTLFLSNLYIGIGCLLFIVPGIILSYSYRLVPYLLAENPDMTAKEVMEKSKAMMQGNKWNVFVLDLSYILWDVLSSVTFGLVGLFYVQPYKSMTDAALYEALKNS